MTAIQKSSRTVITAAFAVFTLAVTANATKAQATEINFSFDLAVGGISTPISFPANIPVHLTATTTTAGFRGVASATLLRTDAPFVLIEWVGLDSTFGAAITQGFTPAGVGIKILFIDFGPLHEVQIETAGPDTIRVRNNSPAQRTGFVTLTW